MTETAEKSNHLEEVPLEHYLEEYQKADPLELSEKTGTVYNTEDHYFNLRFLNRDYRISWPDFNITCVDGLSDYEPLTQLKKVQILVIRYLLENSHMDFHGKFLSYREIPSGEVYYRQFNGRCMQRLAYTFGTKPAAYSSALERMGAERIETSDHGYQIEVFPGYFIQFLLWEADEEFPPSTQILFGDNVAAAFHSEDLVVMSEIVIGAMKKML